MIIIKLFAEWLTTLHQHFFFFLVQRDNMMVYFQIFFMLLTSGTKNIRLHRINVNGFPLNTLSHITVLSPKYSTHAVHIRINAYFIWLYSDMLRRYNETRANIYIYNIRVCYSSCVTCGIGLPLTEHRPLVYDSLRKVVLLKYELDTVLHYNNDTYMTYT